MALKRFLIAAFVLGSVSLSAQPPLPATATGSLTAAAQSTTLNVSSYASVAFQVTGTWVGTITFEGSIDAATYQTITVTPTNSTTTVTTTTGNGVWTASVGGLRSARARMSAYTSGTAVVTVQAATSGGGSGGGGGGAASSVTINDPNTTTQKAAVNASGQLSITCANCSGSGASAVDNSAFTAGTTSGAPAMGFYHTTIDTVTDGSTATLGMDSKRNLFTILRDAAGNARGVNVTAGNALTIDGSAVTQPVSGTFWQATQPVSGTFWQATQPVSGTVTANQGGTWTVQPGNTANTTAWKVDGSAVTQPVSGTFWQATQPVSGTVTTTPPANASTNVAQFGGTNVSTGTGASGAGIPRVTVANDSNVLSTQSGTWTVQPGNTANTTAWKVDGSAVTQPVSGTFWQATQPVSGTFWQATQPISGTVTANQGGAPWSQIGTLTNNNAAPSTNNIGVINARSTAAAPTYTEGNAVMLSTDLAGALRVSGASGGGVAQTQVRSSANTWTDVGAYPGNSTMPVSESTLVQLLQQLLLTQQKAGYVRGSFGTIGSIGDALKVYPTTAQDPCMGAAKGNVAISQTAGARLVLGQPGQRIFVCYARVVAGAAEIPSFTEGTGSVCATGTAAVTGSTTAANGESYAANGGMSAGNGAGTVMVTTKPGDDLCLAQSTSSRLAGNLVFVYAP